MLALVCLGVFFDPPQVLAALCLVSIRRWLAQKFNIASYCAYETEATFGTAVVPMTNALALCNRPADPVPKANHIAIAKPDSQASAQYLAFRKAFKEKELAKNQPGQSSQLYRQAMRLFLNRKTDDTIKLSFWIAKSCGERWKKRKRESPIPFSPGYSIPILHRKHRWGTTCVQLSTSPP